MLRSYKQLLVWQKSIDFVVKVYRVTDKFPKEELFVLVSQIRRAAISIPSNIAEGYNRGSRREYVQFLRIAFSSAAELDSQFIIAQKVDYLSSADYRNLSVDLEEIMKMLRVMIQKLSSPPL